MALSLLNLPKLPYMFIELIKFPITQGGEGGQTGVDVKGPPVVADTLLMSVLPESIMYDHGSKKSLHSGLGDGNVTVQRGGNAPDQISFEGSFGHRMIRDGLKTQDGFGRLKEFRKLFKQSQSVEAIKEGDVNKERAVYGLNWYDFTFHYWGSVDLDKFRIRGDVKRHSIMPYYNVQMTGLGKRVDVVAKDPLLRNLQFAITLQEKLDEINAAIEGSEIFQAVNEFLVDIESLSIALEGAHEMSGQYQQAINELPIIGGTLSNLIGSGLSNNILQSTEGSFLKFADLL